MRPQSAGARISLSKGYQDLFANSLRRHYPDQVIGFDLSLSAPLFLVSSDSIVFSQRKSQEAEGKSNRQTAPFAIRRFLCYAMDNAAHRQERHCPHSRWSASSPAVNCRGAGKSYFVPRARSVQSRQKGGDANGVSFSRGRHPHACCKRDRPYDEHRLALLEAEKFQKK